MLYQGVLAERPPKANPPPGAGNPMPGEERAADQALRRAKLFAEDPDNREVYVRKLKELIDRYPKAQKALDGGK